jgi:hypothetical protein
MILNLNYKNQKFFGKFGKNWKCFVEVHSEENTDLGVYISRTDDIPIEIVYDIIFLDIDTQEIISYKKGTRYSFTLCDDASYGFGRIVKINQLVNRNVSVIVNLLSIS